MTTRWYYQLLMEEFGPVSDSAILELIDDGTLSSTDLVRPEDSEQWMPVSALPTSEGDELEDDEFIEDDSEEEMEPDDITDLSELSFDFEESRFTESDSANRTRQAPPERVTPIVALAPEYYCQSIGQVLGPMSKQDLLGMAESGALSESDLVRFGANGEWLAAHDMEEISAAFMLGDAIPATPIASAPPSTRRLFPTAGKPLSTLPTEDPENVQAGTPSPAPSSLTKEEKATDSGASGSTSTEASPPTASSATPATSKSATAETQPGGKKKAGSASLKKKKRKANAEDDKLLNDIFDDVFAGTDKSSSPMMPAASAAASTAVSKTAPEKTASSPSDETVAKQTESSPDNKVAAASVDSSSAALASKGPTPQAIPTLAMPMSPLMNVAASGASNAPSPVPLPKPKRSMSFSVSGPAIKAIIGVAALVFVVGLIWKMGLPSLGGVSTAKYATRLSEVLGEFKSLGEAPSLGQWDQQCNKARQEFMTYYKAMLDAKATGPENTACIEGIKAMIALAATPLEEKEKQKGLLERIETSLAGLKQ